MKSSILKKARIASAVMLATATMAAGTAQADSIIAPFVYNDGANIETYLSMRVGNITGGPAAVNNVHYYWIQKNWGGVAPAVALANPLRECRVTNTFGTVTPRDMVYQTTYDAGGFDGDLGLGDLSVEGAFPETYAGQLVVDVIPALGVEEGNLTGFAYIVDLGTGVVLDYKMMNNHRSTKSGDFSAGFVSKKSIDYSWWPDNIVNTAWVTAVMADDMTAAAELAPNSRYDATVKISSDTRVEIDGTIDQSPPTAFLGGVGSYDNDEVFVSGAPKLDITCVHAYGRDAFLNGAGVIATQNGGHTRRSITPTPGKSIDATGALTFKYESAVGGLPLNAFTAETSGHLSLANGSKANRPY